MRTLILIGVVVALVVGGVVYAVMRQDPDAGPAFRTATIKRGDLLATISATGTAEPEEVVDVGAQVAGKVDSLGPDTKSPGKFIDYGSEVKEGDVLAKIDDSVYRAQLDQQQAAVLRSQADLLQLQARLDQAKLDLDRAESLRPAKAIADSDYDIIVANFKAAKANVAVGEATIKQAEAALRLANTNVNYTIIKSPVRGVIVDRRVNVGQTVVSSLNAPSLFLIAKDLRKMQVWASVNEADIGRIRPGMPVTFSVDAYPGATFKGEVAQVRLNATMTQNVVTYTVVVSTDNADGRLLPYLTANLQFQTDARHDVLLVPNGALRWKPKPQRIAPELRDSIAAAGEKGAGKRRSGEGKAAGEGSPREGAGAKEKGKSAGETPSDATAAAEKKPEKASREREERGRLWVQQGEFVRPIDVHIGVSDGTLTEVRGADLTEGLEVVVGEVRPNSREGESDTKNPFAPTMFRGNSQNQKPQP